MYFQKDDFWQVSSEFSARGGWGEGAGKRYRVGKSFQIGDFRLWEHGFMHALMRSFI